MSSSCASTVSVPGRWPTCWPRRLPWASAWGGSAACSTAAAMGSRPARTARRSTTRWRRRHDGALIALMMFGYGLHRFVNELLRSDERPTGYERNVSLLLIAGGLGIGLWLWHKPAQYWPNQAADGPGGGDGAARPVPVAT